MKVFKFGGASIETPERAIQVGRILQEFKDDQILVIISAKGKTTNALEEIVKTFHAGKPLEAEKLLKSLEEDHLDYVAKLLPQCPVELTEKLKELILEIEWVISEPLGKPFDYYYDQVVCVGELLSTTIIYYYLQLLQEKVTWVDARGVLKTDDNYRDAGVLWTETNEMCEIHLKPGFDNHRLIITQGFIGSTTDNNSVTLGREGSDYSAAIFANLMNAESVTIWKDVPSLLNGDPKIFPNTVAIPEITFKEVIEMAFYGAQVIHPKTIKPLYNKNIPLYVKCFLDSKLPGTKIFHTTERINYPPILVLKQKQILLQVSTRDYSFITEDNLSKIYQLFHKHKLKINLIQNAAISFVACVDTLQEKLDPVLADLELEYDVKRNENLFLFTVRHYTQSVLKEELKNRTVLLTQKTRQTIQLVVK